MVAVAWAGATLFLASLIYFAYFYLVWLGQPQAAIPRVNPAIAVLIDVLLFTVFALHHSLFARSGAKAWIARRVPRGLERALYVWVASLLFMSVCWLWQPVPGVAWQTSGPARWLLLGVQAPPFPIPDPARFARVVAAAFSMRRKTLRNSLRGLVDEAGFAAAGIAADRRPETLAPAEFGRLTASV